MQEESQFHKIYNKSLKELDFIVMQVNIITQKHIQCTNVKKLRILGGSLLQHFVHTNIYIIDMCRVIDLRHYRYTITPITNYLMYLITKNRLVCTLMLKIQSYDYNMT